MEAQLLRHEKPLASGEKLAAFTRHYGAGHISALHVHSLDQLLFAETGLMRVTTTKGTWVIPTNRAFWLPAEVPHFVEFRKRTVTRSIYLDRGIIDIGTECFCVNVSDLLRELILELSRLTAEKGDDELIERLSELVIAYVKPMQVQQVIVPTAKDPRILKIMDALIVNPSNKRSLEDWGQEVGVSPKTLSRAFYRETNMGFRRWRQQAKLLHAIDLLAEGHKVAEVALIVGYESKAAFISVFKDACGVRPGDFFAKNLIQKSI